GWKWYQCAALLGGIGLAGVFPENWLSAAFALGIAPILIDSAEIYRQADLWPISLALIVFFSLPAPFVGSTISRVLTRAGRPRTVYFVALTSAVVNWRSFCPISETRSDDGSRTTLPPFLNRFT